MKDSITLQTSLYAFNIKENRKDKQKQSHKTSSSLYFIFHRNISFKQSLNTYCTICCFLLFTLHVVYKIRNNETHTWNFFLLFHTAFPIMYTRKTKSITLLCIFCIYGLKLQVKYTWKRFYSILHLGFYILHKISTMTSYYFHFKTISYVTIL